MKKYQNGGGAPSTSKPRTMNEKDMVARKKSASKSSYKDAAIKRFGTEEKARAANAIMQSGGSPCGPDEVRTPGGKCIKKRFITSPEGVATVLGAATAAGAAIKNKIAKKKEAKAEVAKTIKDMKGATSKKKMKTGGMVNANAAIKKQTVPGSKGVMSGENPKATASKVAKGRSGGTSTVPKTAIPKAQMGGMAGGIPISERAAARKVKKGKGAITKSYPSGPEEKGSYVGFSKEARKSNSPFKSMKDSKPARPIRKKGGAMKKGY